MAAAQTGSGSGPCHSSWARSAAPSRRHLPAVQARAPAPCAQCCSLLRWPVGLQAAAHVGARHQQSATLRVSAVAGRHAAGAAAAAAYAAAAAAAVAAAAAGTLSTIASSCPAPPTEACCQLPACFPGLLVCAAASSLHLHSPGRGAHAVGVGCRRSGQLIRQRSQHAHQGQGTGAGRGHPQ
jgi:hypothetical protein